jgi:hypothetical protein
VAREGHFVGETDKFHQWAEKSFGKKRMQIRTYMALAEAQPGKPFKNIANFKREYRGHSRPTKGFVRRPWTEPVDQVAERALRIGTNFEHGTEEQIIGRK